MPFGEVTVGYLAGATVTVTNDDAANLLIGNIGSANPLAAPFSIESDNCSGGTLSPGTSCTLTARFEPTATGTFNDSFDIPSNDPDEDPVTVNVSGTGTQVAVPDITVTDSIAPVDDLQVPFGEATLGYLAGATVTVTNDGAANLLIGNIGSADPLAAPFSIESDNCSGGTLTPGASCTLIVRFELTATGTFNDSFDIQSDDPDEDPVTVNVSGTGTTTDVEPVIASISNQSTTEGSLYVGPTPTLIQGTQPITWSLVTYPSGMVIDSSTGVVNWPNPSAIGSPHTITIRATNTAGYDDEGWQLTVNVVIPPVINPISNDSTTEGTPYTGPTPSLSQGTLPVTWSLQLGPSGMTINPSTGVVSWANPTVSGSPHTITIRATNSVGSDDESWQLTVTESQGPYDLTVNIDGSGNVVLDPDEGTYDSGTEVELTAIADPGWVFSDWSGDLISSDNPATITMNSDKNVTAIFLEDSDNDGISDEEEDSGPNGGDGNNDGILDSQQSNVISLRTYDDQHNVTMELPAGTSISNCKAADNPSPADSPVGVEFPYGFFEFTINGLNPGDAVAAILYLPDEANPTTYYRYGPTPSDGTDHWYEFLYDVPTQTGAEINSNVITLHFVDGQRGDDVLTADGTVIDQGGPGFSIIPPTPDDDGGGCFIAIAVYGSPMEPQVNILRDSRDRFLLINAIGKGFVRLDNTYSPAIADCIAKHDSHRAIVRVSLLPIVGMSWVALKIGLVTIMALMLLFCMGIFCLIRVRRKFRS